METDVFVAGGGPAGLAAALAARRNGLDVVLADRAEPPIDKACGEGVMPDGLSALRGLGVDLGAETGFPFRGIRFVDTDLVAEASFPHDYGLGVRRTHLHRILRERAEDAGVVTRWRSHFRNLGPGGLTVDGQTVHCRWIVGADGCQSRVREWARLPTVWSGVRRIGVRQHFRLRPWTNFVEVHWRKGAQAYVTPVGSGELCIAMLGSPPGPRISDMAVLFPDLARRLAGAEPIGRTRGAISMSTTLRRVTRGRVALVGDASGAVDAVTGEGLSLAFRQAAALGPALATGGLADYEKLHRRLRRVPLLMARLLVFMGEQDGLRRRAVNALAARPSTFNQLLAIHTGAQRGVGLGFELCGLACRMLSSRPQP